MFVEGHTLAPHASAGVETPTNKEIFVFLKLFGLDTWRLQRHYSTNGLPLKQTVRWQG